MMGLTELGISQKELARDLEITVGALSKYKSGETLPNKSLQEKMLNAFGLPLNTLDDLLEN